jgi:hypothetical protein
MTAQQHLRRVAVVGAGATGAGIVRGVLGRRDLALAAVIDSGPGKPGTDVGELVGAPANGLSVQSTVAGLGAAGAHAAIVATVSRAEQVLPTILELVEQGLDVVTVCEELSYLDPRSQIAQRLDAAAHEHDVTVVGTGVNPGFIMDTLPLCLTAVMDSVHHIAVTRRTDFSKYSGAIERFGLALTPDAFSAAQREGRLAGFLGFEQSIRQLSRVLGWQPDEIIVEPLVPSAIAGAPRPGLHVDVPTGAVAEVSQRGYAMLGDEVIIDLRIIFGYLTPDAAPEDRLIITGGNQRLVVTTDAPGFVSLSSTAAIAVNVAAHASSLSSGFHTTPDLPVRMLASVGTGTGGAR